MTNSISSKVEFSIPHTVAEVDTTFLSRALRIRYPGTVVESAEFLGHIHGASSKLRIQLTFNDSGHAYSLPERVIVKAGFEQHSEGLEIMHRNEVHAYNHLVPTIPTNTPRCLFAGYDDRGRGMVILEDLTLKNVRFLSLQEPIGFDLAKQFLDELAGIHAAWWNSPMLDAEETIDWLLPSLGEHRRKTIDRLLAPDSFDAFNAAPRGAAIPKALKDPGRIRQAFYQLNAYYAEMPNSISHGDMHLGNLFVDANGKPGLLDWQPRRAPWSNDVTYFLIAGLDVPDRRRWEQALLQHYLSRLESRGVRAPGFDEAWIAHRRDVMWGFFIWFFNGFTYQSEANNTA
ncbi:MAG: phosphotransferase, partial [Candidatus Thorarchaeota archaeon]